LYDSVGALSSSRDLEQGDLLACVPRLLDAKDIQVVVLADPKQGKYVWPAPDADLAKFSKSLRAMQTIQKLELALVISNSCDNATGDSSVQLAPVKPFVFSVKEDTPAKKWIKISHAATSTANPKVFYLSASPANALQRSRAELGDSFFASHSLLQLFFVKAGLHRICRLKPEAVRHLQWSIGAISSRNPREDGEWPSDDDFSLKAEWLREEIEANRDEDGRLKTELQSLEARSKSPLPG